MARWSRDRVPGESQHRSAAARRGPGWDAEEGLKGAELTRLRPRAAKSSPGAMLWEPGAAAHAELPTPGSRLLQLHPHPRIALDQSAVVSLRALANDAAGRLAVGGVAVAAIFLVGIAGVWGLGFLQRRQALGGPEARGWGADAFACA
jgi:hypothetical protein